MGLSSEVLALVAQLNKANGAGTAALATEMRTTGRITSGSLALDVSLGGGWPVNQWIEVIGKESHGKTTIIYKTIAANQDENADFTVLWIAAEHYDHEQAAALGVDNSRVITIPTVDMEFAYETALKFIASKTVDVAVIDSYPALSPKEELEKDMDERSMATGARLTAQFFRKVGAAMRRALDGSERPITCFFINQWRDDIGGFSPRGTPKTTPGGKAKNYVFYTRVEVSRLEYIDEARPGKGKTRVGQVIKTQTLKNKSAPPGQIAQIDFYFRDAPILGFPRGAYDLAKEYLTYGVLYDLIKRRGTYYDFNGQTWGPGKDKLLEDLRQDHDLQMQLRRHILTEAAKTDRERMTGQTGQ